MSDLREEAKSIGASVKRSLKGKLPAGSKVSARKDAASMLVAVIIKVTTPTPERFHKGKVDMSGFTPEGRDVLRLIAQAIADATAPFDSSWTDTGNNRGVTSLSVYVNDRSAPMWVERGEVKPEGGSDEGDRPCDLDRPTVRRSDSGRWVVDLDGRGRNCADQLGTIDFASHAGAMDFLSRHLPSGSREPVSARKFALIPGGLAG